MAGGWSAHLEFRQESVRLEPRRPLLALAAAGEEALAAGIDAERRKLMRADEQRLAAFEGAAVGWAEAWPSLLPEIAGLPLCQAHKIVCASALHHLPFEP